MRIITGSARGTKLETLSGEETRPTTERVKEAIFSMIQFDIEGRRVLDLFGGSGQMGLEALSRGASVATFVDSNAEACAVIKRNAQKTHLYEKCNVLHTDWNAFLRGCREPFDIVFLDPPYAAHLLPQVLRGLTERHLLAAQALVVCEDGEDSIPAANGLTMLRHNKYSHVYITLFRHEATEI